MNAELQVAQRITRLTPFADVLAHIDANVAAIASRLADVSAGVGRVLAEDAVAASALPENAVALRDGWAVQSEMTSDAGSYSPAIMSAAKRVDSGETLPEETDAVAPLETIVLHGDRAEALAPIAPGDGVLAAQSDTTPGLMLRRAGEILRAGDAAVLAAAGLKTVSIRTPRIRVTRAGRANDNIIASCLLLLTSAINGAGGIVIPEPFGRPDMDGALRDETADAVIVIGGTGTGHNDNAVVTLARAGKVAFHGIGIGPGETAAIGAVGPKPVLLVPGRLDAALACWLLLGRIILARLAGRSEQDRPATARLSRKVTSSIGIAEVIPVLRNGDDIEPLASGYLPLQALARADGFILVPADSEGYPAGATVPVRPLP